MSETQESLSSILGDSPFNKAPAAPTDVKPAEKAEAAPSAAKEEAPVEKGQPRDEGGKFAKAETEKPEEKPLEKPVEKPRADVAAIMDERRKRQALEAELKQLREQQPAKKPSVFENEDEAFTSRVSEGTRELREQLYTQSVEIAQLKYKGAFAEAQNAFAEAAEADPRLYEGLRAARNPGEYIYSVGLQIRELADVGGDFVKYREKLTGSMQTQLSEKDARIKALETELDAMKKAQADLDAVPRSLNSASSGAAAKGEQADDEPIEKLVRFGNK